MSQTQKREVEVTETGMRPWVELFRGLVVKMVETPPADYEYAEPMNEWVTI